MMLDTRSYTRPMPTTPSSSGARSSSITAKDLSVQLDNSQSSVIYVDIPGCTDQQAADYLFEKPPLHVEHDAVRNLWAVRKATPEEVADAEA